MDAHMKNVKESTGDDNDGAIKTRSVHDAEPDR
jgi:hypothetical protein